MEMVGLFLQVGIYLTRRIFIIEGLCTVVLAVALYFVLPNRVDDCKWLNNEEKTAIWERKSAGTAADPLARKFEWHYLTECLTGRWYIPYSPVRNRANCFRLQGSHPYMVSDGESGITAIQI